MRHGFASFIAGSLITARLADTDHATADSNRVFELGIYRTLPGKVPALESRFRDTASKLIAKHVRVNQSDRPISTLNLRFARQAAHNSLGKLRKPTSSCCRCGRSFLFDLCDLFGVSDEGGEARVAVERSEIGVLFDF